VRRSLLLVAIAACAIAATPRDVAKPVSTDGEATIYVIGNFTRGFNVAYDAVLRQERKNRSTTFLSVMLLGRRNPSGSIAIGLTRAAPAAESSELFVATTTPGGANHYETFPALCLPACGLILRGDRYGLYAFATTAGGIQKLGSWARADFQLVKPYLQLNAEVAMPGDRIVATLAPLRVVVDSADLSQPRCAFTTRGIMPRRNPGGTLEFTGTYRSDAIASFVDLENGKLAARCPVQEHQGVKS
jgi:hypothetical protein